MEFYTKSHQYSCGIDLHGKSMYVCVLDPEGNKVLHRNIRNDSEYLLKLLEPYKSDVAVAVECTFNWYWVADLCADKGIPFVLGHALYMKAIHGGKAKNDKIDSEKIARLLRSGMLPQAYTYPKEMRSARDLMRRRSHFSKKRGELFAHIQMTRIQYNIPEFPARIEYIKNRAVVEPTFSDSLVASSAHADLRAIERYDEIIKKLDLEIIKAARIHDPQALHLLKSIHGVGPVLALTILYEIHTIKRFPRIQDFLSYSRLVKSQKESGGKKYGTSGAKIGNVHLKWAFSEAAVLFLRGNEVDQKYVAKLEKKHGKGKALGILATKLGRAVYTMLSKQRSFDMTKFLQ